MNLSKNEEKILNEYVRIQSEFNVLKNHMIEIKDRADGLVKELEAIRENEKELFEKLNKKNG